MNADELKTFLERRRPSPNVESFETAALQCYGCAHSASSAGPPGAPSGERPCCSCVRNPEHEERAVDQLSPDAIVVGDDGHARIFDPFAGSLYNGAPRLYQPMDNYVTLDHRDQERWLDAHPEYEKSVRFDHGALIVIE